MSCFLEILKCILCCEEDSYDNTYSRTRSRPFLLESGSERNEYLVRNSTPTPTTTTPLYRDHYQILAKSSLPSASSPYYQTKVAVDSWISSSVTPQSSSSSKPSPSSYVPPQFSTNEVSHSSKSSSPLPPAFSSRSIQSPSKQSAYSYLSQSSPKPPPSSSSSSSSSLKPPVPSSKAPSASSPTSYKPSQSSPSTSKQPPDFKPILHIAPNNVTDEERKTSYICEKGTAIYAVPEDIKGLIKRDIVPEVLKQPLSPSTYKAYFAALLYAEDYYLDKWSDFLLKKVTLELEKAAVFKKSNKNKYSKGSKEKDDKIFVAFDIDCIREKRPYLLSRDMVNARPSDKKVEPFQGFVYRVVRSNRVLVEFGDDFHSQHHPNRKYDISFSFNRVCLKRAHQAIEAAFALDPLSHNLLFPECVSRKNILSPPALLDAYDKLNTNEFNSVRRILSFRGSPPYLLGGELVGTEVKRSVPEPKAPATARTGLVVCEAVIELYKTFKESRILICAPTNHTCDELTISLREVIPDSDMFRANAAFREVKRVPVDILLSCPIKDECFTCPPLAKLRKFKIILSTFVSSFRLYNEGIPAGHFSHIFLVDASSTIEPEATIALAHFANENTAVIVTGAPKDRPGWVRSDIAWNHGLEKSYFERLLEFRPYKTLNPMFITEMVNFEGRSKDIYK
ncbi:probable RNA helicase SDE3 isoform X2 [Quercus robur]|nr:probable RNA helicase SDE3 isoform X2 [Quercus robur]XP_050279348.1 probable RNA helicase SDE3 isoform X2 [Quercus robur]